MTELEYYKERAHLWELACFDFRARGGRGDDPDSFRKAVEFSDLGGKKLSLVILDEPKEMDLRLKRTLIEGGDDEA